MSVDVETKCQVEEGRARKMARARRRRVNGPTAGKLIEDTAPIGSSDGICAGAQFRATGIPVSDSFDFEYRLHCFRRDNRRGMSHVQVHAYSVARWRKQFFATVRWHRCWCEKGKVDDRGGVVQTPRRRRGVS